MNETKCPFCDYEVSLCQCKFTGSAHPALEKKKDVVLNHLYLLTAAELDHVMTVQESWNVSYSDPVKQVYLDLLKRRNNNG